MHKIIHSDFQIDLSNHKVSFNEENHWFSDQFFTKYSFPFVIKINEELSDFFEYLKNYNTIDTSTIILLKYVNGNNMEDAILEIEEIQEDVSVTLKYVIEEFPNFNKKLSELPLEVASFPDISDRRPP